MKLNNIFKFFLVTTILLIPFYIIRFKLGSIPTTLLEVLVLITFILSSMQGRLRKANKNALFWGGLFVLAALLAVFFDPNRTAALGIWKAYFFDDFLFFSVILALDEEERKKAREYLILGGALTSALAIAYFLTGVKTVDGRLLDLDRLSPNYLAMFLVPIFILNLREIFINKDRSNQVYLIIMVLLSAAAIWLTNSRAGQISTLVGIIVLCYEPFKAKVGKKVALSSIIALAVLLLGVSGYVFRPQANDLGRTGSSSNIRYYIWSTTIEIIEKNPISGVGLNNYQNYFSDFTKGRVNYDAYITPVAHTAHNLFLQIYVTMGLFGFLSFIALIVSSKFWKSGDISLIAALVSIFVFSLFDTPFFRNDLSILFWLLLALAYLNRSKKGVA